MRVIIAGSRTITDPTIVALAVEGSGFNVTTVVSGGAHGVDYLGEEYAVANALNCTVYPADWDTHGKQAGFLRNMKMAANADALIAIWDGKSKGTAHMIEIAAIEGLQVHLHMVEDQ